MIPVRPLILVLVAILASCAGQTGRFGPSSTPTTGAAALRASVLRNETGAPQSTEAAAMRGAPSVAAAGRNPVAEEPGDIWAVTKDWDRPRPPLPAPGAAARRRAQAASSTPQDALPPLQQESDDFWSGVR